MPALRRAPLSCRIGEMPEVGCCPEPTSPAHESMTPLTIVQNNMAGVSYFAEILMSGPDVCLLQDPSYRCQRHLTDAPTYHVKPPSPSNYRMYYSRSEVPRALILSSLPATEVIFARGDAVCIRYGKQYYCSLYLDPRSSPEEALRLFQWCTDRIPSLPKTILGMDSNSHHPSWGSGKTCSRGHLLAEAFLSSGLVLLNRGSMPPTYHSRIW